MWGPVGHAQTPPVAQHPQQLSGSARLVRGEHRAKSGGDDVETAVREGQLLGVGYLGAHRQPFHLSAPLRDVQQIRHVVAAGHVGTAAGGRQRCVAGTAGHIQHPLSSVHM